MSEPSQTTVSRICGMTATPLNSIAATSHDTWTFGTLSPETYNELDIQTPPAAPNILMPGSEGFLPPASNNDSTKRSPWVAIPEEVIELSDDEPAKIKQEPTNKEFDPKNMQDHIIELSDSEVEEPPTKAAHLEETGKGLDNNKLVEATSAQDPEKAREVSNGERQPLTRTSLLQDLISGKSNPNALHHPIDRDRMREIQQVFVAQALEKPVPTGAGKIFSLPQTRPTLDNDGFEWMTNTIIPDDLNPSTEFQNLKKVYKAKRKARKNTLEDDIDFKKAQRKETERINILVQNAAGSDGFSDDDDEAEESEDGLFIPESSTYPGLSKRPFSLNNDNDNDDDCQGLIGAPTGKFNNKESRHDKPTTGGPPGGDPSTRRQRERAYKRERAKELRYNMMAGIEAILLRDQMKQEMKASKALAAEEAQNGKYRRKKAKGPTLTTERGKTGRVSNVGSLMTSDVYADSNANVGKSPLPVITEKKKKEFLSSLIASVPLEDQKQARSDKCDILRATRILGSHKVLPDGQGSWSFKGMRSSLYHHQVQGAACMKNRELGEQEPYGGILADEMGLGKTIQTIAAMLANRQTDPDLPTCTLVVCSPSLMSQWEHELEKHVDPTVFRRIVPHHGKSHYSGKGAEYEMEKADIILTTYGEVLRSYPKCLIPKDIREPEKKRLHWMSQWEKTRGLLHRAHFYRVVLDEAQAIKNHTSQTSIACRAVMARHRWAISGTPIQNRLEELFPYFKFLRVRHTGSLGVFRQNFCQKESDECHKRLVSVVSGIMIRRTHADTIMGKPLHILPKNTQTTVNLKFNEVERHLYEKIRLRCIRAINAASRRGSLEERTKYVIMMFQRLRQMVAHVFLVQEMLEKEFEATDVKYMWDNLVANPREDCAEKDMMVNFERMISEKGQCTHTSQGSGLFEVLESHQTETPKRKKSDSLVTKFGRLLRDLKNASKWPEFKDRTLCQRCGEPPEEPHVTSCYHLFCKECLISQASEAAVKDQDRSECSKCGTTFSESIPCDGLKELEIPDLAATVLQNEKEKAPIKKKYQLTKDYVDSNDKLLLSTKVAAVKSQLKAWIGQDPDAKIIVFTEWHMIMHIVGRICQQEGWNSCQYNGKMTTQQRDQALSAFRTTPSVRIMIASLKCGGTGLNLIAASKVICVDLWFNRCVEQQAFCRVHRIGQTKETYITRFKVENTVDDRLIKMQEEKRVIIDNTIDNRELLSQLTLPELMRLFGPVSYDEESKPFIMVDDEAEAGGKKRSRGETPQS
ncbi:MAG: hypothetical protein Q9217_003717 [Psora testacea]